VFVVHFPEMVNDFPIVQKVRTGSWVHFASYSMSTGGSSSGQSGWSVNFNTHLHILPNLRMCGATHPLLHTPSWPTSMYTYTWTTNTEAHSLHDSGLTLSLLMSCIYMKLLVEPEILTSCMYMDLRLATLKAVSFYLLHNVSTLNQFRKFSCVTVVCKHFANYQDYPNYRWNLIR
jgi:hypothetical protein